MFSLSRTLPRASRSSTCFSCLRKLSTSRPIPRAALAVTKSPRPSLLLSRTPLFSSPNKSDLQQRAYAAKSSADELIEEIQEQYGTARDEFEIASEETEKNSLYAPDDRAAAREELDTLKEMYEKALGGADGEEIQRRVGQRIRELDQAVQALEQSALGD